jgi:hypothetical protein
VDDKWPDRMKRRNKEGGKTKEERKKFLPSGEILVSLFNFYDM